MSYFWSIQCSSQGKPMHTKIETLPEVIVGGCGAAGFSAALALADKGYKVKILEKDTLGSGSSGRNPGRMGLGFHYVDKDTAIAYLHASIEVQKTYPGFLIDQDNPNSPLRKGRYFILKNSNVAWDKVKETYDALKEEYTRLVKLDERNKVFGEPETFYRKLEEWEYQDHVNKDIVEAAVETHESLFNWDLFSKHIRQKLENHKNITLCEHTEIVQVIKNKRQSPYEPRFTIIAKDANGREIQFKTNNFVNSAWENIDKLNASLGLPPPPIPYANRLKALVVLTLPEELKNMHSAFFCFGEEGCMVSNLGKGVAMATCVKQTNVEYSITDKAKRLLEGKASDEEKKALGESIIKALVEKIPAMANATWTNTKYGVVQTLGELKKEDINNPNASYQKRDYDGVDELAQGIITNRGIKLFYMLKNGQAVLMKMDYQMAAHLVIIALFDRIKAEAERKYWPFKADEVLDKLDSYASLDLLNNAEKIEKEITDDLAQKANLTQNTLFRPPAGDKHSKTPKLNPKL